MLDVIGLFAGLNRQITRFIVQKTTTADELAVGNDDGVLERERERVGGIQEPAVGADDIMPLRLPGIQTGATEQLAGGIFTATLHRLFQGQTKAGLQGPGHLGDFGMWRPFFNRQCIDGLQDRIATDVVAEPGIFTFADQCQILFGGTAGFEGLVELFNGNEQIGSFTSLIRAQCIGGMSIQIGGLELDLTSGVTTDPDMAEDWQGGFTADHAVKAGQGLFQFLYGEGYFGIHFVSFG